MVSWRQFFAVSLAVLGISCANAQPLSPGRVVLVEDLLRLAAREHPSIASAKFGLEAAQSQTDAAKLQFWPSPSVQTDSLSGSTAVVLRLTQPIWTGGKLTADLARAEVGETRASTQIQQARMAVGLRLMGALQSYLQYQGRFVAQEKGVQTLSDLHEMIRRRGSAGVSSQSDLNLMEARLAQARGDLEFFRGGVDSARARMREMLGVDVALDGLQSEIPELNLPPVEDARSRARDVNPNIRVARVDARLARIDVDRARAAMWPTVSVRAEHQYGRYLGSMAPGDRVYVNVQYSPGAGLGVFSQVESAQKAALAAEQTLESVQRDELEKVQTEYRELEASRRRQSDLVRAREEASRVLDSNRRLFVGGRRSWIDLLNSAREVVQAEQAEADVEATLIGSYYRLTLLTGALEW